MKVKVRKYEKVAIITFDIKTKKFKSRYEVNKFFRGLYGWEQTVPGNKKKYHYHRCGVLDRVPHAKIADSVLLVAFKNLRDILNYLRQWEEKIDYEIISMMMEKKKLEKMLRWCE